MQSTTRPKFTPLILVNVYWLPLSVQEAALLAIAIPAALVALQPRYHVEAYAVLASIISTVNVFLPWPVGVLSDKLRGRGTARWAIGLAGAALNVTGLIFAAHATTVGAFAGWIFTATIGQTISTTSYQAMLPDTIARPLWGIASGIRGAAALIGTVVGLAVAGLEQPATVFYICAGLVALGSFSMLGLHQRQMNEDDHAHVRDWHDFIVVFIARAFIVFGLSLLTTFVLYFFRDVLHSADPSRGTGIAGMAALLGAAAASIALGVLSDRVRAYRKVIVALCGIPMTLSAIGYAIAPHESWIFIFALLFGVGYGGVLSTGWALALDAMPRMRDAARDLGIWGMATHIPAIIAPLVGGAMIRAFHGSFNGYRALFAFAALAFAIGSSSVLAVRGNGTKA